GRGLRTRCRCRARVDERRQADARSGSLHAKPTALRSVRYSSTDRPTVSRNTSSTAVPSHICSRSNTTSVAVARRISPPTVAMVIVLTCLVSADDAGRSGVDGLSVSALASGRDLDLARLGLLGHGDLQPQHPVVIVRTDLIGIEVLPQEQLPAEDTARSLC